MRVIGIIFYATVITLFGVALVIFALYRLPPQGITDFLVSVQNSFSSRIIVGLSGILLVLVSFSFAQLILGRFQSEKTIAFPTPSGEVTISLAAVEDLIRKLAGVIPEIKELRPDVVATKRGIVANLRVILKSEVNIPELTSRLQDITRIKIQEVLGVEEEIIIKIHIAKIISQEVKDRRRKEPEKEEPTIPFSGYGRA